MMWLARHRWSAGAGSLVAAAIVAVMAYCCVGSWRAVGATQEHFPSNMAEDVAPLETSQTEANPAVVRQPDLRPEAPRYLEDTSDPCTLTWVVGMVLYVSNQGTANAGPFEFTVNSTPYAVPSGLAKGQTYQLAVREWPWSWLPNGNYDIIVDTQNQILESDEGNNRLTGIVPMVTPRVSCTPSVIPSSSATATAGPSPTPTATASPSPTATAGPSPTPTVTASPSSTATVGPSPTLTATVGTSPTKRQLRLPILQRGFLR